MSVVVLLVCQSVRQAEKLNCWRKVESALPLSQYVPQPQNFTNSKPHQCVRFTDRHC